MGESFLVVQVSLAIVMSGCGEDAHISSACSSVISIFGLQSSSASRINLNSEGNRMKMKLLQVDGMVTP
jgi:hypothetical protein